MFAWGISFWTIFERLSSKELLDSCQKRLTQNQNESLNNVVWSRCPKRVFCSEARFKTSVWEAIVQFNEGSKSRYYLFKTMNITPGDDAVKGLSWIQRICIRKARQKISEKYKKRQQALRQERRTKKQTNRMYLVHFQQRQSQTSTLQMNRKILL